MVGVGAGVAACLAYLKQQELKSGSEVEIYENVDGAMDSDKATPLVTIGGIISAKELDQPVDYVHPYSKTPWFYQAFVRMEADRVSRADILAMRALLRPVRADSDRLLPGGVSQRSHHDSRVVGLQHSKVRTVVLYAPRYVPCRHDKSAQPPAMRGPAPQLLAHTRRIIRASLGRDIEEIFESFDEEPIASGTVAQVHRARLRPEHAIGGSIRDVAVKIQHPNVLEETFCDVDLLWKFVKSVPTLAMPMAKEDFALVLQRQTNFEWEAYNLQRLAINFKKEVGEGIVRFPDVATDLLSPAVLVESWADGATVGRFFSEIKHGVRKIKETTRRIGEEIENAWDKQKRELAEKLFELNMKMFLRDNLVHSDMHAGNILFSEENGEITVLDAGQTATLHSDIAPRFGQFLHSICTRNKQGVHENLIAFDTDRGRNWTIRMRSRRECLRPWTSTVPLAKDNRRRYYGRIVEDHVDGKSVSSKRRLGFVDGDGCVRGPHSVARSRISFHEVSHAIYREVRSIQYRRTYQRSRFGLR